MAGVGAAVLADLNANYAGDSVALTVTHSNLKATFPELKFSLQSSVEEVKMKLSQRCGTAPASMDLILKDSTGAALVKLDDDNLPLGHYSPHNGCILHVVDLDPSSASANGWLDDVSQIEKFEMSDEAYSKRENTFRKFKEGLQGRGSAKSGGPAVPEHLDPNLMAGSRCKVAAGDRRGCVRYVGPIDGLPPGTWVGVEYDEPVGKNDGSAKGKRYFQCQDKFGGFVRPSAVTVGDFPPLDVLEDGGEI
ncbi:unnamed protein product [Ostreobium quekettii]|uniref:CAP-Gly domain-containing protein n=1 Tax=Ostreobium quekettii TaxID=121088 RepID=A0A8S1ILA2_9CHLO|nr:unnamed protein product [Ostreobium quekettii]|eukprot:evm.model.scf_807EXC.5 EVM.evm.TU.scf_807EXC.5   scf_807EXC:31611-35347(-)